MRSLLNSALVVCLSMTVGIRAQVPPDSGKQVGPGVTWSHEFLPEGPLNYNVMRIEIQNPHVTIETESGQDRLFAGEKVLSSVKREAEPGQTEIIGGVNADFWSNTPRSFWPVGLLVADGMIYNMPASKRSAFVLTKDEVPYIGPVSLEVTLTSTDDHLEIDRINSGIRSDDEIVLFTPPYGDQVGSATGKRLLLEQMEGSEFLPNQPVRVQVKTIDPQTTTPLEKGQFVLHIPRGRVKGANFSDGVTATLQAAMPEVNGVATSVCGGGPAIVSEGKVHLPLEKEGIPDSFSETKHPRTALGFTRDRKTIYLVTVDGRQPRISVGNSLEELAAYMVKLGCWQAINLDGGGSTTMVVNEKVVNEPSDFSGPRTVANSLLVVAADGSGEPKILSFDPEGKPLVVPVGATLKVDVSALNENFVPVNLPAASPLKISDSALLAESDISGNTVELKFSDDPQSGKLHFTAGDASGDLAVKTVKLDKLITEPEVLVLGSGDEADIHLTAMANGKQVELSDEMIAITSDNPEIATVGESQVEAESKGETAITVRVGSAETKIPVFVDLAKRITIEDFETVEDLKSLAGTAFDEAATELQLETGNVKKGKASIRLNYKMERGGRTRINLPVGEEISEAPAAFSIWVYGDGKEAWLRANLIDNNGVLFIADFTNGADGITWEGEWQHLSVSYQSLIGTDFNKSPRPKLPLKVRELVIAQDQEALKKSGSILLDGFEALYPPE